MALDLEPTAENLPLLLLAQTHPTLARRVADLPWVTDGIDEIESSVLSELRGIAAQDLELTEHLVDMPFFVNSGEDGDALALFALKELSISFPRDFALLKEQSWFTNGLSDVEASYVAVLWRHATLRTLQIFGDDDFRAIAVKPFGESAMVRTITLPRAGEVELIAFNRPLAVTARGQDAESILDHIEESIRITEDFLDSPFPQDRVLVLFTPAQDPDKESDIKTIALYVGTHMIVNPDLPRGELNRTLTHELAHYYLNSSGGLPFWFVEGGASFLASFVLDKIHQELIGQRKSELTDRDGGIEYCKIVLQIDSISTLLSRIASSGIREHKNSSDVICNYYYGEVLFLELLQGMGEDALSAAWSELYELSETEPRSVTEDVIYDVLLRNTKSAHAETELKKIYQHRHRGVAIN